MYNVVKHFYLCKARWLFEDIDGNSIKNKTQQIQAIFKKKICVHVYDKLFIRFFYESNIRFYDFPNWSLMISNIPKAIAA